MPINHLQPLLANKTLESILEIASVKIIPKGESFIHFNQYNNQEYILIDGIARSYFLNEKGNETTIAFYQHATFLPFNFTRTYQGKSLLSYEALIDCEVMTLDATNFQKLVDDSIELQNFVKANLRSVFTKKMNREIRLATWKAKDRLKAFREEYNQLENLIPHPMIASFLGITNVSLSRLRGQ